MTQVYDYLQGYAYFYEYKYKFPLKIGRVFKDKDEKGHIIVGLTSKMSQKIKQYDLSELKWIVFDECDQIK